MGKRPEEAVEPTESGDEKSESLGTADIPPLDGEFIPAQETDGVHPDAGSAGQQPQDTSTADLVAGLLMLVHGIAAKRFGKHWELQPSEAVELGSATGAVLDKYFPNLATGPEVRLLMTAGAVYGIRYVAHLQWKAEHQAAEKSVTDAPDLKGKPAT